MKEDQLPLSARERKLTREYCKGIYWLSGFRRRESTWKNRRVRRQWARHRR